MKDRQTVQTRFDHCYKLNKTDYINIYNNITSSQFHPEIFIRGGKIRVLKMRWGVHDSVPSRGVWGHVPPENFGILDTQRVLLVHFLTSKKTSVMHIVVSQQSN